jgi:hypothetical protein
MSQLCDSEARRAKRRSRWEMLYVSLVIEKIHIPITTTRSLKNYALFNSDLTSKVLIAIAFSSFAVNTDK